MKTIPPIKIAEHIRQVVIPQRFREMLQAAAGEYNEIISVDNAFAVISGNLGCYCSEHDIAIFFAACGKSRCRANIDDVVKTVFSAKNSFSCPTINKKKTNNERENQQSVCKKREGTFESTNDWNKNCNLDNSR